MDNMNSRMITASTSRQRSGNIYLSGIIFSADHHIETSKAPLIGAWHSRWHHMIIISYIKKRAFGRRHISRGRNVSVLSREWRRIIVGNVVAS